MSPWVLRLTVAVLVLLVVAGGGLLALDQVARRRPQDLALLPRRDATVHGQPLSILVADTPSTVGPGLSGQPGLPTDQGLLLVSPDGDTKVTMLGMRFALDVVWLDAQHRVVRVARNVAPRPLPLYRSGPSAAAVVLEVAAGTVDRYGITEGDVIGH